FYGISGPDPAALRLHVGDRADFQAAVARPRETSRDAHRLLLVAGFGEVEARQQLAGLGERADGDPLLAAALAQGAGGRRRLELLGHDQRPLRRELDRVAQAAT